MPEQIPLSAKDRADDPDANDGGTHDVCPDLAYKRLSVVNVAFIGAPQTADWVLVDTGLPGSAGAIQRAATERYGDLPPRAIVLTHGHIDHAGCALQLAEHWHVSVYAHPLEQPYLNGRAAYPHADPGVGGGAFSLLSPTLPRGPLDLGHWLQPLAENKVDSEMAGLPSITKQTRIES